MAVEYYINDYLFTTGGVYVGESKGLIDGLKLKDPRRFTWPDHHGEVVDLTAPRYESREITLNCFLKASNMADFQAKILAFLARFMLPGLQRLKVVVDPTKPLLYLVYLPSGADVDKRWYPSKMVGTFNLKLKEPEPVKRVYGYTAAAGSLTLSFAITTTEPVNIYWGDGSVTYDVITASGTVSHEYATAGSYYIIITGIIENITGVTTTATLLWSKL